MTRRHALAAALAALTAPGAWAQAASEAARETALARVRRQGRLVVAVYQDLPPFCSGEPKAPHGIDVDLAGELAAAVGVPLSLLDFPAGESIGDDLRNAVWRGHYLGWGPADVMLHVPMERLLIEAHPQVDVFGPYYRERLMLAWDRERGGEPPQDAAALRGRRIAVAGQSLAGALLAGADGGALRETLSTRFGDGVNAARALEAGDAEAAAGLASELESVLARTRAARERYALLPLPLARAPRNGWVVGCAVRRGADDLARVLQDRLLAMTAGPALRELFARHGVGWRG
ncbi:MAG TPA: ABC transporter substrate-binding protein [Methylibium sp.]|uniref:substrate-binding periplasmic protein n=1 Tax=Methylibium sp. TaxID=2067992 RepID=UPI002DBA0F75|nr:ABC transporter substrate-binding protein [Methylibium sp.]HEU4458318.1 ABC transporter substrate-binding protein [Methylibium sp.]